jgi:hypothetical protein
LREGKGGKGSGWTGGLDANKKGPSQRKEGRKEVLKRNIKKSPKKETILEEGTNTLLEGEVLREKEERREDRWREVEEGEGTEVQEEEGSGILEMGSTGELPKHYRNCRLQKVKDQIEREKMG